VAVLTEERWQPCICPRCGTRWRRKGSRARRSPLPPGEATKGWAGLDRAVEWLLDQRVERRDLVVALGGGVIGDLAGFAAAILRRGVGFVQIPTTLLAQVDSAVGGKTGINTAHGKNLIGAFHQPAWCSPTRRCSTRCRRATCCAGYGEVVKYGLLGDAAFFAWLEANGPALAAGDPRRGHAVRRSCEMKAGIVARDETETGERALLNLGHTFGHALEAATGYSDRLLHGEGVAIGCALALRPLRPARPLPAGGAGRVRAHLAADGHARRPVDIPGDLPDADGLLALMAQDKKVQDGMLTFILTRDIGEAFVTRDVPASALHALLAEALAAR
jgi:3-dehydroquinate synthase